MAALRLRKKQIKKKADRSPDDRRTNIEQICEKRRRPTFQSAGERWYEPNFNLSTEYVVPTRLLDFF